MPLYLKLVSSVQKIGEALDGQVVHRKQVVENYPEVLEQLFVIFGLQGRLEQLKISSVKTYLIARLRI